MRNPPLLKKVFNMTESEGPDVLTRLGDDADKKLGRSRWEGPFDRDEEYGGPGVGEQVWEKANVGLGMCRVILQRDDLFNKMTGRGPGREDRWMVDIELALLPAKGPPGWVLHSEKNFPSEEEAMSYAERAMAFIDASTPRELLKIPRSGKFSMSKMSF